jgi:methionyl-tRNA formyltransferase
MSRIPIIFFGTSEFGIPTLVELIKKSYNIKAVVTQPGLTPIKKLASQYNIAVVQPTKINISDIIKYKAKLGVLVAYGQIINKKILDHFKYGIINLHPSLLPKYRGPSPIQYAILNNEKETGVTLIKLDEKLDSGPILAQESINITEYDNYISLSDKLSVIGANLIIKTIPDYLNNNIEQIKQNEKRANYSKIIKRSDGEVTINDLKNNSKKALTKLKAYSPWPGIYFIYKNKRYKIIDAHIDEYGKLRIDSIQPEAKKPQTYEAFKNGYPDIMI